MKSYAVFMEYTNHRSGYNLCASFQTTDPAAAKILHSVLKTHANQVGCVQQWGPERLDHLQVRNATGPCELVAVEIVERERDDE